MTWKQHTTVCCFRGVREGIRLSTNSSNIDIIARTRNRRCVHRNPERLINGQLSDSTSAQREWENQDQERSKTGGIISPKLLTATLESIFRRLNWENKGVKIDGEFLSNLRFADVIFLCTEAPQELQHMLKELSDESRWMGLKMNIAKTKVMVVDNTPINVNNVLIENVQGYVYLGQHYSLKEKNQDKEIQRRIMAGWAAHAKHRDIFKSNLAICFADDLLLCTETPQELQQMLQKQPCHLPEETRVQLLCAAGYGIWCRDLDTDQTSTEQTCGRTDQNVKKYAQHHIQR